MQRESEAERGRDRDRGRGREKPCGRETQREAERSRERQKETESDRETERDWERRRDKERENERELFVGAGNRNPMRDAGGPHCDFMCTVRQPRVFINSENVLARCEHVSRCGSGAMYSNRASYSMVGSHVLALLFIISQIKP